MGDLKERFRCHVEVSAALLARDLVSLLNRAQALGIAVCPDVDPEGISYSIEWGFDGSSRSLDVEWLPNTAEWTVTAHQDNDYRIDHPECPNCGEGCGGHDLVRIHIPCGEYEADCRCGGS